MTNKQKKARATRKFIRDSKEIIEELKQKGYDIVPYKGIPGGFFFEAIPNSAIQILNKAGKVHSTDFNIDAINLEIAMKK